MAKGRKGDPGRSWELLGDGRWKEILDYALVIAAGIHCRFHGGGRSLARTSIKLIV
jgi:hypothetical protein